MGIGHILFTAVNAVFPILLLILLGYFLKRKGFLSSDFLAVGNKLVFRICLPCSLFVNVYEIAGIDAMRWDVIGYALAMVLVICIVGLVSAVVTTPLPARRGVIMQCAFRSNLAIIGIPLAAAIGSIQAQGIAAMVVAFAVPFINVLAVIALSIFGEEQKETDYRKIILEIGKNPLIIGAAMGMVALSIRELQVQFLGGIAFSLREDAPFLYSCINELKKISTPLALIVLGGQFVFSAVKGLAKEIFVGTFLRLIVAPVLGIGLAILLTQWNVLSLGVDEYPALIALFGSPVAVSSAIMAQQMRADGQLAVQYVMWTSLGSVVTVFITVCLMMGFGLLAV